MDCFLFLFRFIKCLHSLISVMLDLHLLAVLSVLGLVARAVALLANASVASLALVRVPLSSMALVTVRVNYGVG